MPEFLRESRSDIAEFFRRPSQKLGLTPVLFAAALLTSLLFAANFFSLESDQPANQSTPGATAVGTPPLQRPDLVFVQAKTVAPAGMAQRFPEGSRLVRLAPGSKPQGVADLTPDFFAVSDPQVSFDGSKVLFAGKAASESRWQIWEMGVDGSGKRQVTHCDGDCLRPAYMARDQIVYTELPAGGRSSTSGSQLYVGGSDGSDENPITFGPGDFQVEAVLQDGRILASARDPLGPASRDGGAVETRELYTLRPDGTALAAFRCDHHPGVSRGQATELDDRSVVFVKTRVGRQTGGELAVFRQGSPHNSPLAPVSEVYGSPRRWNGDGLIVAKQQPSSTGRGTVHGIGDGGGRFDLYSFDVAHGRTGEALFADPGFSSLDAAPVASHTPPRWYWSILNPQLKVGYFVCLDSRISMDAAGGRFSSNIVKVRVLTLDAPSGSERVLGEAPVESDGSFYIAVPPDQPVRFETLDSGGKLVHAQRSWIWSRSGEERGCVGCHDDKAVAAENTWPLALKRLDSPTRLGEAGKN
ncbi:MAG TPA: hypothetical protein VKM93_19020 [Terriglobia bacterium]|nr:hypothetical protein [Terriglobia bacterium]